MAAFQFSVQQVSFPSEDLSLSSSLDSLSSVVDPNVDFCTKDESSLDKKEIKDITEEWKCTTSVSIPKKMSNAEKTLNSSSELFTKEDKSVPKDPQSAYPTISFAVAQYMNEKNPELCQEAERYFNSESFQASHLNSMSNVPENTTPTSTPLHSMSIATEALALQHSVIGNFGVKPVSADIVAQVVANTRLRLEKGEFKSNEPSININSISEPHHVVKEDDKITDQDIKKELIRYPSGAITSTVEKHSWFSNSPTDIDKDSAPKSHNMSSHQHNVLSKSSSQSSINSIGRRKSHRTNGTDLPKLHSSNSPLSKISKYNNPDKNSYTPYEVYPDSSVEYETESSLSEKFEVESMCSEAFETESNFSEFSAIDDDVLQMRKNLDLNVMSHNSYEKEEKLSGLYHLERKDIDSLSLKTEVVKSTTDKGTGTDGAHNFQLLREKALLEGRLESIVQERSDLVKEKDHYCSLATSYEAQLKSLQNQLDSTIMEKKNTIMMFDTQSKEHKNWDNIIKEYQGIIVAKNAEIKGLKDDLSESEQANTRTKIRYEELKVDMELREGAVGGLKKKIAELHVEVQILLQGKIQLENEVKNVRHEMDTLQKSKDWFQEQLHITQENRNKLHQQLIQVQSNYTITSNDLEKVIMERNQLKQELVHTQQRAVAEKEVLMKQLETIEADMKERESLFDDIQKDKGSAEAVLVERIRKMEEEKSHLTNLSFTVSNQEHELRVLKNDCEEKAALIQSLVKEKAELHKQVAVLQKSSNDKDLSVQQLMQQLKDANIKMKQSELALRNAEELIGTLKDERTAADVALASVNADKRVVNESLKAVGENLYKLQNNFKHMKAELVTKSSQNDQLLKEKQLLEETARKNEESLFLSRREFEQQVLSENQNRIVMFDDLKKKKTDVENVLNVYSKDLLNYQQTIENLSKQKVELISEVSNLKQFIKIKDDKIQVLGEENTEMKIKVSDLENKVSSMALANNDTSSIDERFKDQLPECQTSVEQKSMLVSKSKAFLYKKLKDKIKECKILRNELEVRNTVRYSAEENNQNENRSTYLNSGLNGENKVEDLEIQLKHQNELLEEKIAQLKESEKSIIDLEKEKGKAISLADKCDILKQRTAELEAKLSERDAHSVQLSCLIEELKGHMADLDANTKIKISSLELDLNKERTVVKSLRQQVFQEKRGNSHLQKDLHCLKTGLEQANQIADAKKQEISSLQAELFLKMEAELKHRAEIEHFQTEISLQRGFVEKLNKELEEVKARDPALAEQIKALSWRLKEKSNEVVALQEKLKLMEERYQAELEGLKTSLQETELFLEKNKKELDDTRKEKFNYQSKVIELRKALKSKLVELESKGILRVEKKSTSEGPIIHLNIPDPEVSFDESYVNDLLQKSMHLSESRPLSNLQDCLNSLKEEMVQLQKKIVDNSDKA